MTETPTHTPNALIGLGGKPRSGKDAVADYLVDTHGFQKLGMSDNINKALLAINPLVPVPRKFKLLTAVFGPKHIRYTDFFASCVDYAEAKANPEVRRLLQDLGVKVGRDMFGESSWVDMVGSDIDRLVAEGNKVIVTGLRFPSERDMVESRGGTAAWVNRPSRELQANNMESHSVENGIQPGDFQTVIENDGTLDDLYRKADLIASASTAAHAGQSE
jgi:hypothetical protein